MWHKATTDNLLQYVATADAELERVAIHYGMISFAIRLSTLVPAPVNCAFSNRQIDIENVLA